MFNAQSTSEKQNKCTMDLLNSVLTETFIIVLEIISKLQQRFLHTKPWTETLTLKFDLKEFKHPVGRNSISVALMLFLSGLFQRSTTLRANYNIVNYNTESQLACVSGCFFLVCCSSTTFLFNYVRADLGPPPLDIIDMIEIRCDDVKLQLIFTVILQSRQLDLSSHTAGSSMDD